MSHTDVFIVIDRDQRVLLVDGVFPEHTHAFHFWQSSENANRALKAHYGIDAITLRVTQTEWGADATRFTYLMHYRSGAVPPNSAWTPADQAPEPARSALTWLAQTHPHRVAWYAPDFVDEITRTMRERFGADTRLEQVRSWGRSSIWRLHTEDMTAYLKVVPPMFAHEPQFSARLAQAFLHSVPALVAVEAGDWFVMADYGGESLFAEGKRDLTLWERALREYAQLQLMSRELVLGNADGLPVRDFAWIAEHWRALLTDATVLNRGTQPITVEERQQIADYMPKIEAALAALSDQELTALTHGDFWAGQIVHTVDDRLLFTDWSDAVIAYPFFDAAFFLAEISGDLPNEPEAKSRLVRAYLSEWGAAGSADLYAAAEIIAPLYTALRYHHDILPRMEIAWEMENMLNYSLRLMLKACAAKL